MTFKLKWYRRRKFALLVLSLMAVFYMFVRVKLHSDAMLENPLRKSSPLEADEPTTHLSISPVQFNIKYNFSMIPDNGPVVLITSNRAFLDFAENWLESVRRLGTHPNILAIAEDIVAYRTLQKYPNVTTVMTQRVASPQKTLEYLSHEYNVLINKRPVYIFRLLMKGRSVLFSDVDTVWLKDPMPYLEGDHDVVLQEDLRDASNVVYCAGFIFFRATNTSRALIWEWMGRLRRAHDRLPDQKILNEILAERFFPELRIKVLNSALFPNGKLYFDERWRKQQTVKPVIVHNNWIKDHREKVDRFKSHGFWFI